MADRMVGMLDRDPELKKYALRQGLKAEDIKAAKEINAPKFVDLNNERRESLGDIQLYVKTSKKTIPGYRSYF